MTLWIVQLLTHTSLKITNSDIQSRLFCPNVTYALPTSQWVPAGCLVNKLLNTWSDRCQTSLLILKESDQIS